MAAPSDIDANFMSDMLRERTFSEKQTSNDDPLPAILDQDLSENVDHAGDTIADADDDDADEGKDYGNRKRIVILVTLVISVIAVLALIGVGIFVYYKFRKLTPVEIVQKKCKEYTNLACSLQSSSNKGPSQIIKGNVVRDRKMFPHQIYIQYKTGSKSNICSGSLISENFILTAAHCVEDVHLATMKVLVGSLNRQEQNKTLWKAPKKFYVHPDYDSTAGKNPVADLGLIELEVDVEFNSDIRPICLNTKLEKRYNNPIYVAGWGVTKTNDPHASVELIMTEVRIDDESDKHCREYLESFSPERRELLSNTIICVAHLGGGGLYQGDSGGPLQVKLQSNCENTWEQIGIGIQGIGYNDTLVNYQEYVKVEYYIPWIVSVVWPDQR